MLDISALILFIGTAFVLLVIPGPAVIYITAQSIDQGTKAGIISTLGIALGSLIHVMFAALGLSTILVTSSAAFDMVKYIGAGYLIYLGVKKLLEKDFTVDYKKANSPKYLQIFYKGIIVNLFNPKTALFFFAFLPQFIDLSKNSPTVQMIFLGFIFILMGIISDGIYAILAGKISGYLKRNARIIKVQKYMTGIIYILLGAITAFSSGSHRK